MRCSYGDKDPEKWGRCSNVELPRLGDQLNMEKGRKGTHGLWNDFWISGISVDAIA